MDHRSGATRAREGIVTVEQPPQSLQAQRLADLRAIPIAIVTADASAVNDPKAAETLRQAGCTVEAIALASRGIRGNGTMVMMEKNNREALATDPRVDARLVESAWAGFSRPGVDQSRRRSSSRARRRDRTQYRINRSAARRSGGFFVGITRRADALRHDPARPDVRAVHDSCRTALSVSDRHGARRRAQGTHMMGLGRRPGWVHYSCRRGYAVYWLDRPSYGRSPYHPDALGPSHLPNVPPFEPLIEATNVFKTGQWPGPGGMDDPYINQFMACESGNTSDEAFHTDLVWPGGVELVDRIGPCILHGHAFGGFFAWGVADRRPAMVKGIVCMEINGNPFERQLRWG
jgi:hypothetical protein